MFSLCTSDNERCDRCGRTNGELYSISEAKLFRKAGGKNETDEQFLTASQ